MFAQSLDLQADEQNEYILNFQNPQSLLSSCGMICLTISRPLEWQNLTPASYAALGLAKHPLSTTSPDTVTS